MSFLKYFVAIFLLISLGACSTDSNEPENVIPEMEVPQDNDDDMNEEEEEEEQEDENVFEGDVTLTNQDEVDNFGAQGYERITGDLQISFNIDNPSGPAIVNLNALNTLTTIGRSLTLSQLTDLNNLTGLENIENIAFNLFISNCSALSNIDALTNTDIEFDFFLNSNQNLETLPEFAEVQSLNKVFISNHPNLQEVNTLNSLISIETSLEIINQFSTSIEGFNNLVSLNSLKIIGENISSITGFQSLTNVTQTIQIASTSVTNIDFLSNITQTQLINIDNFQFPDSPVIDLNGLSNIQKCNTLLLQGIKINDLLPLSGLEELNSLIINQCQNIESLNGLENLTSLYEEGDSQSILINANPSLINYCSLNQSYLQNFEASQYDVQANAFNPSFNDLLNGDCVE